MARLKVSTKLIPNTTGAVLVDALHIAYSTKLIDGYLPYEAIDISVKEKLDELSGILGGLLLGENGNVNFNVFALKTDLDNYATIPEINALKENLEGYATKDDLDKIAPSIDESKLEEILTSLILGKLNDFVTTELLNLTLSNYYTKEEIDTKKDIHLVQEELDPIWNSEKSNYYTKEEINNMLTILPILGETDPVWTAEKSNYALKSQITLLTLQLNTSNEKIAALESEKTSYISRFGELEAEIRALKNGGEVEPVDELTMISVNPDIIEIYEDENIPSFTITGTYTISGNKTINSSDCTITSSDLNIVSYTNSANVVGTGVARLNIMFGGRSCSIAIIIKARQTEPQPEIDTLLQITVSPESIDYTINETVPVIKVSKVCSKSGITQLSNSEVTATSSDLSIVEWTKSGIKFNGVGNATITFTYQEKTCSLSVKVNEEKEPELISLTPSTTSITRTEGSSSVALTFTAKYDNGKTEPVTDVICTTTDQSVSKWENNKVTIVGVGSATLEFTYQSVKCQVAVNVREASAEEPEEKLYIGYGTHWNQVLGMDYCEVEDLNGSWNGDNIYHEGFVASSSRLWICVPSEYTLSATQAGLPAAFTQITQELEGIEYKIYYTGKQKAVATTPFIITIE